MVIVMTPQRVIFHIKLIKNSYFNVNRVNSFFFLSLKILQRLYIPLVYVLKKASSKRVSFKKKTHFYSKELI